MDRRKIKISDSPLLVSIGIGLCLAGIISIVLVMLTAVFIHNEYIDEKTVKYIVPFIEFISVFNGALGAGKSSASKKEIACIATGIATLVLQLCVAMLFFDGIGSGIWGGCIATVTAVAGAIYMCSRKKKSSKRRRNAKSKK